MMEVCTKCDETFDNGQCDSCRSFLCIDCGNLTASEVKCMQLKTKRKLKFFCETCEDGFYKVSALIKEVSELKLSINKILNKENESILTNSVVSSQTPNMEVDISELHSPTNKKCSDLAVGHMYSHGFFDADSDPELTNGPPRPELAPGAKNALYMA
ncbi:unnamed protein product [Psylliodes chrysocephalus]|uniref:Uncharacterized protein n=1 Tax=Psylliodes chrysocephalus TaxID=3402493 RepID=A0A9P0GE50_9CUCU|nr:unnamed protein product [Psylliodes chrysocephala]